MGELAALKVIEAMKSHSLPESTELAIELVVRGTTGAVLKIGKKRAK
jgi:DNA-binding LacI/PurR family transcriptional regulator